jgi:HNH endonuclease
MQYKIIDEFPNYEINEIGEIRNIKTGRILKSYMDSRGFYFKVRLVKDKGTSNKERFIHRLLALAFISNNNSVDMVVDHINGIKTDNRLSNLRWVTIKENLNNINFSETGIILCKHTNKWIVKINNKIIGYYNNIDKSVLELKQLI